MYNVAGAMATCDVWNYVNCLLPKLGHPESASVYCLDLVQTEILILSLVCYRATHINLQRIIHSAVCAVVRCLSVTSPSRYCIETAEWIEMVFGAEATLSFSYTLL